MASCVEASDVWRGRTPAAPAPVAPAPPAPPTPRATPSADVCPAWCPSLTPSQVRSCMRLILFITSPGCGPECLVDPDCQYGFICSQQRCVEKPDPCDPSPCGPGAEASVRGDLCQCDCPPGTVGDPYSGCQRGECTQVGPLHIVTVLILCCQDPDCDVSKACSNYYCVDPCLTGTCQATDFCRVMNHRPICGFNYEEPPQVQYLYIDKRLFPILVHCFP